MIFADDADAAGAALVLPKEDVVLDGAAVAVPKRECAADGNEAVLAV